MRSEDWKRNAMNLWWHCHGAWWWASGVWEVSDFCPTLKVIPGSPLAFHRRWTSELPQVALTHQCASVCVCVTHEGGMHRICCWQPGMCQGVCVHVWPCLTGTKGIWDNAFSVLQRTMCSSKGFLSRLLKHTLLAYVQLTVLRWNMSLCACTNNALCMCIYVARFE